jgi:dihydrofolate synthase / folylpolyglutamate synthase
VHNAAVAVRLLEVARAGGVHVPFEAIVAGLTTASWPARLERLQMRDGRQVLLDAAHNAEGALALSNYLARWHPERPVLVVGVMRDKDTAAIVEPLLPRVRSVLATAAPTPRALPAADLEERLRTIAARLPPGQRPSIAREEDPLAAVTRALELGEVVVVAGSIFLVGPVREGLLPRANLR